MKKTLLLIAMSCLTMFSACTKSDGTKMTPASAPTGVKVFQGDGSDRLTFDNGSNTILYDWQTLTASVGADLYDAGLRRSTRQVTIWKQAPLTSLICTAQLVVQYGSNGQFQTMYFDMPDRTAFASTRYYSSAE